jgi:solute carrier family 50 protein (sugar transporter)
MQIPNVLGVIFAVGQVIVYAIYYKSTQQILEARKVKASRVPMTEVLVDGKNGSAMASGAGNDN